MNRFCGVASKFLDHYLDSRHVRDYDPSLTQVNSISHKPCYQGTSCLLLACPKYQEEYQSHTIGRQAFVSWPRETPYNTNSR